MIIYLIGFMGSGKSTAGRKLSARIGWDFIDLDAHIEGIYGMSVNTIFNDLGEESFRDTEAEELRKLSKNDKLVLACGGGTPCYGSNMKLMNSTGLTIYLRLSPAALESRLRGTKNSRPLIKDLEDKELSLYIKNTLEYREKYYMKSKEIVEGLNLDLNELLAVLEARNLYIP